jgi:hypothetical protein
MGRNAPSRVTTILYNDKGTRTCSAKRASWTPDDPKICASTSLYENGRCKKHGGATPKGIASPHFKTGKHSRHLPSRLLDKYQEALEDPELMSLESDLALVQARINDLLEQLDEGGAGKIMLEVSDAVDSFEYANQDNDRKAMREAWRRIKEAVEKGKTESSVWAELYLMRDQKRKLTLAEAKRLQTMDQMIKVTQVNLLISALLDAVRQNVSDKTALAKISEAFVRITQGPGQQRQLNS